MNNFTVVMYHYVRNLETTRFPLIRGLELKDFYRQINYFERYYNFIRIDDLLNCIDGNAILPNNPILLTFDDGYLDHFTNVFPILNKKGIQGCFYPSIKSITERCLLDINKIHLIIASLDNNEHLLVESLKKNLNLLSNEYEIGDFEFYYNKYAVDNQYDKKGVIFFKRMLQAELPEILRTKIIDSLFQENIGVKEDVIASELYMTEEQIKCMVRNGMHFGCHGFTHQWLDRLSAVEQEKEIDLSLDFLKEVDADVSFWSMTYPSGVYDNNLVKIIRRKGCKIAFTVESGVGSCDNKLRFYVPRMDTTFYREKIKDI